MPLACMLHSRRRCCQDCRRGWLGWRPRRHSGWEVSMSARRLDASGLREWAHTSVGDLISHTDEINRLNVFPVADADTGTNMLFTMRSAWAQADMHPGSEDVEQVAAALAEGALHGARGNSGVILSQIL